MNTKLESRKAKVLLYTIAPTLILILTFIMEYKETLLEKNSDIVAHMHIALSFSRLIENAHCGWHFFCWLMYACLPISINVAAALTTALFNAISAILIIWLLQRYLKDNMKNIWFPTIFTVVALLVGPLYVRFFNHRYYMGQGTPNVWHNPTSLGVRPFMIIICILTIDYWECRKEDRVTLLGKTWKKQTVYQLGLAVLLAVSTIIKPSFLMVYLPSCGIIALVKLIQNKGKNFWQLICAHLYFIPSLICFLWQYIYIFLMGGSTGKSDSFGIQIAFFKVAGLYTSSIAVSLVLKMAFPFMVIILWRKKIFKDKLFLLAFLQFLAGLAITWTFAETGKRLNHGNFGWGNLLASSYLWIVCMVFYAREWFETKDRIKGNGCLIAKFAIPALTLLWHLLAGISYYFDILFNMSGQL